MFIIRDSSTHLDIQKWARGFAAIVLAAVLYSAGDAATLLPNGKQQFINGNGVPLASGTVYMYTPFTSACKQTWQDPGQTMLNACPIVLDANGEAIIYGTGSYRQQVYACATPPTNCDNVTGVLQWDQLTADTSSNNPFWAGLASGTPNAVVVTDAGFSSVDGTGIQFLALGSNTGNTTLTIGSSTFNIVKETASGPALLSGGEIASNNVAYVVFSAAQSQFQLLNPVPSAAATGIQVGFEISCPGFTAPTNYVFEYGQAISRTGFNSLLLNLTLKQNGTIISGNNTITGMSDTSQMAVGQAIEGVGIPGGTTVASIVSGVSITMSTTATLTQITQVTVFPYGNGDGSTTFNVPDRRGVALFGRDNMGGSAKGTLTSTFALANPDALGVAIGGQSQTLTQAQLPAVAPTFTGNSQSPSLSNSIPNTATFSPAQAAAGVFGFTSNVPISPTVTFTPTGTISNLGSGNAHSIVPPGQTTNMCLRAQ